MPPAPLSPVGAPAMFGPMNPPPGGSGFPPPLFAHFSPFPPGSPPSPMFTPGMPPRPGVHQAPSPEASSNAPDSRMLRQLLQAVSKMGNLLTQTDQTLNDVTVRQSSIEDRLSLMEQRILRIDSRALEVLDQDRNTNDNVRKAVVDIGNIADDVRDIRNLANDNDTRQESFENRMAELVDSSISKCTRQIDSLGEDIKEIKNLVRESAKYALMSSLIAAPPSESVVSIRRRIAIFTTWSPQFSIDFFASFPQDAVAGRSSSTTTDETGQRRLGSICWTQEPGGYRLLMDCVVEQGPSFKLPKREAQYESRYKGVDDPKAAEFYLGKKVAFVYRATREVRGSKIRVIWGKVTRPHGMIAKVYKTLFAVQR
ncbi:hypothetical protein FGG08_001639 [Glutinoglossum americanum]|uniref:Uncharacterized protein n=1 Tax=Glutinoglossum americanum TaxID=1670608 RepID=A0A9P8I6I8_9PEZI|nr:hypothetical protein FGG08_001639 [Glutinoglossum americanum]